MHTDANPSQKAGARWVADYGSSASPFKHQSDSPRGRKQRWGRDDSRGELDSVGVCFTSCGAIEYS